MRNAILCSLMGITMVVLFYCYCIHAKRRAMDMDNGNGHLNAVQTVNLQKTKLHIDQEETSYLLMSTEQNVEPETVNAEGTCILPETPVFHASDDNPPPVRPIPLGKKQVLDIVAGLFENRFADRIDQADVLQDGKRYIVTIPPQAKDVPEGCLHYGPSYSARIILDGESGELVEARIGR